MTLRTRLLILLLLLPGLSLAAPGDVFYVDGRNPQASDDNPGSEAEPWRTIQKAADTLQPGETVLVKAGVYTELTSGSTDPDVTGIRIRVSGMPDQRIVFRNYPGHRPVIDQLGTPRSTGFVTLDGDPGFITIEGFEIRNTGYAGVFLRWSGSARGFVIRKNHIHHIDGEAGNNVSGINNWGGVDLTIEDNIIHDIRVDGKLHNGNASGVGSYEAENMVVRNNLIFNTYNGIYVKRPNRNLQAGALITRNLIRDVHNAVRFSEAGSGGNPHVDQEVSENLFHGVETGVFVDGYTTEPRNSGLVIRNNTILARVHALHLTWFENVEIYNNIMVSQWQEFSEFTYSDCTRRVEFVYFDNNLYPDSPRFRRNGWCGDGEDRFEGLEAWQDGSMFDQASLTGHASFVDEASEHFELSPESPGIGAGRFGEHLGAYPTGTEIIGPRQLPAEPTGIVIN